MGDLAALPEALRCSPGGVLGGWTLFSFWPQLEDDLADISALKKALSQLCTLQSQDRFRAIQLNFSPDQIGYVLTDDHVLQQFPELIPL